MARKTKLNTPEKRARIGERIKVAAAQAGLTLKELAEKTGTSPSFIYQYVRGITGVPSAILEQIAINTQVPLDFFDPDRDARSALTLSGDAPTHNTVSQPVEDRGPDTQSHVRSEIRNLEMLGEAYNFAGRNPAAYFSTIEQRLALTRALQDRGREALLLEELGNAKRNNQRFEEAFRSLNAAIDIFTAQGMEEDRIRVVASLSNLLIDEGRLESAHALLANFANNSNAHGNTLPLLALSRLHHREHCYVEALRAICKAASHAGDCTDKPPYGSDSAGAFRGPLTDLALSTGRFRAVQALWTDGLKHAVSNRDPELFLDSLIRLGQSAFALGQLGHAREKLESAVSSGMLLQDVERTSIAHALLARVQIALGTLDTARENARAAHRLARHNSKALPVILAALANAECALALGRWQDALEFGQDAVQEAHLVGRKEEASQAFGMRARAYLGLFERQDLSTGESAENSLLDLAVAEAIAGVAAAEEAQSIGDQAAARFTLAVCYAKLGDDTAMMREALAAIELSETEDGGGLSELIGQEEGTIPTILCSREINLPLLFKRGKSSLPALNWQAHFLIAGAHLRKSKPETAFLSFKLAAESLISLLEELTPSQIVTFEKHHIAAPTVLKELVRCAITDEAVEETIRLLSSAPWFGHDTLVAVVESHTAHAPTLTVSRSVS